METQIVENKTLSLFNFHGNNVRVFGTHDEPWFVAKDIGEILGLKNYRDFVGSLEPQETRVDSIYTNAGRREVTLINESALYQTIFQSRKEEAKKFKKWVFSDLLPTLRRTGKYEMENRMKVLEAQNQALEKTITNLEKKQYITDDDKYIMISDRIIEHGYISREEYNYLMSPCYENIKGRVCRIDHPDKSKMKSHLMHLSKRMSNSKKKHDEKYPDIRKSDRRNAYYLNDYKVFGDEIIHEYFQQHPLTSWSLDFEW